jgi:transcriptional regulator with XRE-family HTH domain
MKTFGSILRASLTERGVTMEAAAKATGTRKGYISGICSRKVNPPSAKLVRKLCKLLSLDEQDMLARATFEKFPKGLEYSAVQNLIVEAKIAGLSEAPGSPTS